MELGVNSVQMRRKERVEHGRLALKEQAANLEVLGLRMNDYELSEERQIACEMLKGKTLRRRALLSLVKEGQEELAGLNFDQGWKRKEWRLKGV